MYLHTKNEVSGVRLSKVGATTEKDMAECITVPIC